MMTNKDLTVFYGISSPWAYLGAQRMAQIAARTGARIVLRPIRIIEQNGGIPLRTRPDARQRYHEVELARWRTHLGIPLNLKPLFYPCRTIEPAARAVIAAQDAGLDALGLSFAIQRALWSEDRDIADLAVLSSIVGKVLGPNENSVMRLAYSVAVMDQWLANLGEAEELGIFGTPTYVVAGELFWGQDRLDFVERALSMDR